MTISEIDLISVLDSFFVYKKSGGKFPAALNDRVGFKS